MPRNYAAEVAGRYLRRFPTRSTIVGTASLERHGDALLLRSVTVAPTARGVGVGSALVTTALGLFVAIPAVMMFNYFTGKVEAFDVEMDNSSSELVDYFLKRTTTVRR